MLRCLYNFCFPLVFVLLLPGYLRRMVRRGNFQQNFGQRLGFYSPALKRRLATGPLRLWVQAVSVGEMLVALKLIDALRAGSPSLPLVLSTTTTTGYQLAAARIDPSTELVYTPIDLAGAVRRAFDVLRPSQVVIVDGGLWPNQLWEAKRRGIPTALVNARLSPRSARRFRRFRRLSAAMFRLLDLVCVPEQSDFARWEGLGVPARNLRHTGSIKFDDAIGNENDLPAVDDAPAGDRRGNLGPVLRQVCPDPDAPVLLAGSTHAGEERIVAEVFLKLRHQFRDLFLIVAPRHVERTAQIRSELELVGLRVATRTTLSSLPIGAPFPDLLLLDTTGELRDWYALATVVFIGKSLTGVGGQNPAEAISAGKPVVFGPHMENFSELTHQLLAANAAIQVEGSAALENACARLLSDPAERHRVTDRCFPTNSHPPGRVRSDRSLVALQPKNFHLKARQACLRCWPG